jgi:hypothetical protein
MNSPAAARSVFVVALRSLTGEGDPPREFFLEAETGEFPLKDDGIVVRAFSVTVQNPQVVNPQPLNDWSRHLMDYWQIEHVGFFNSLVQSLTIEFTPDTRLNMKKVSLLLNVRCKKGPLPLELALGNVKLRKQLPLRIDNENTASSLDASLASILEEKTVVLSARVANSSPRSLSGVPDYFVFPEESLYVPEFPEASAARDRLFALAQQRFSSELYTHTRPSTT